MRACDDPNCESCQQTGRGLDDQLAAIVQREKELAERRKRAQLAQRKAKKGRKGPGRDRLLGQRFEAAVAKRRKRRAGEKAGRKAARRRT